MAQKESIPNTPLVEDYPGEMFYQLQGEIAKIQGWPAFRNRPGRIGLDPLDTDFELAHLQGVVIRKVIVGEVFTTNPIYLFVMAFYGLVCIFPLIVSISESVQGRSMLLINVPFILHELLGISLLRNVFLSVRWANSTYQKDNHFPIIE